MIDYNNFRYKPFDKGTIEELERLPEFQYKFGEKDKAISYMILAWAIENNEWQKQFTRYADLKREAALLAGFKLESNKRFSKEVEDLLIGKNIPFNRSVIRFLYLIGVPELPALAVHRELQSAEMEAAFSPDTDAKQRKDIRVNIDAGTVKIKEYENLIFGGAETEAMRTELYKFMESLKIKLQPEVMAGELKSGKLKIKDPYYGKR